MPDFLSPAAAYTSSLEGYMQHRESLEQQAMQNALARQREDRLDRQAQAELALQQKEADERIRDKQIAQVEKSRALMEPGDVEAPMMRDQAEKLGLPPIRLQPPKPFTPPEAPAGIADPNAPPLAASTPEGTGVLPNQPQAQGYTGTFKQREAVEQKQKIDAIQQRIRMAKPGSDEYQQALVDYEMEKTGQIPASAWKQPSAGQDVYTEDPRTGIVKDPTGHPVTHLPPGAKIVRLAEPMPQTPHFVPQDKYDENGKPQSGLLNNITGEWKATPGQGTVHAPPGSAQLAVKAQDREHALVTLNRLDGDIDAADKAGILGPFQGRVADIELQFGNNDPIMSTLATRMKFARMLVDTGIGGVRAAASPNLIKLWDNLLDAKATPENLHAVTKVMKQMLEDASGKSSTGDTGPQKPPPLTADAALEIARRSRR